MGKLLVHISKRRDLSEQNLQENDPPCSGCFHHGMGYLDFHEYCRSKKPAQYRCPVCGKFSFLWQLKGNYQMKKRTN